MKSSGDAIRQTFYFKGFNLMAVGRSPHAFTKSGCVIIFYSFLRVIQRSGQKVAASKYSKGLVCWID